MNWYTKRLTLAAVYKSTELFMIQDKSENFKATYEFLDNRLKDLGAFNQFKTNVLNLIPKNKQIRKLNFLFKFGEFGQILNGSLTVVSFLKIL